MNSIGVAASKINTMAEVAEDPLIKGKLLKAKDHKTGFEITLAPAPVSTPDLEMNERRMSFPPRFGEHNEAILGNELGMSPEEIAALKAEGII
jgi:crotonobetainyl-CoA:carnitine CoA-transferase CaiB-like acyl-CoA transferase